MLLDNQWAEMRVVMMVGNSVVQKAVLKDVLMVALSASLTAALVEQSETLLV